MTMLQTIVLPRMRAVAYLRMGLVVSGQTSKHKPFQRVHLIHTTESQSIHYLATRPVSTCDPEPEREPERLSANTQV